ncbi:MAG: ThiF family adenylyltransferase, partial [Bacteroidia bacterium]
VGEIGIVDFDRIDESNLQRQILYTVDDIGKFKSEVAENKLSRQNPFVRFTIYTEQLNNQNALEILKDFDIVVDGTDNFPTRYLVNDACTILDKPLIYGSIYRFEGQVSVFNYTNKNGIKGPTYRCLFPAPPTPESSPNCSAIGVLGVLPGIIGTMQANETIKLITGAGETLSGKLLLINALTMNFDMIEIQRNNEAIKEAMLNHEIFLKTDYNFVCEDLQKTEKIKNVTAKELMMLLNKKEELQILDVREEGEMPDVEELVDLQIPLVCLAELVEKISRKKKVIVFCRSGGRSKKAIELLQKDFGFVNLYNLDGGILEWLMNKN